MRSESGAAAVRYAMVLAGVLALVLPGSAFGKPPKDKESGQNVDSGTFAIFTNGRRVATETFSVQEVAGGSQISAQVKTEGSETPTQSSELRISAAGDLVRYEWRDLSGSKASLVVTPNDQFLIERVTTSSGEKPAEQPFLMPSSTMVLDNNFFVQRQLLVWRYLGSSCKQDGGKLQCPLSPADFGVLVPQDRTSMRVSLQVIGREKVKVNAAERDLLRLDLKEDNAQWSIWIDDQNAFKVMRIVIGGANTEVVRE